MIMNCNIREVPWLGVPYIVRKLFCAVFLVGLSHKNKHWR